MGKMQQVLLALVACVISSSVSAQINANVEINGISGELATNVRLFLSIEQHKNHALMSEGRLRRLHKKAPREINQALQPYGYYQPIIKTALTQSAD